MMAQSIAEIKEAPRENPLLPCFGTENLG
jgi:hypothetical protein